MAASDIIWTYLQAQMLSHAGSVVQECSKDNVESQRKSLKFDPAIRKRLNRWLPTLAAVTTSQIPTPV